MDVKPSLIVVDDDESLLDVLKNTLVMTGYSCEVFSSAESALEHLVQASPNILLTDIIMKGMKGLELTRQAKRLRPEMSIIVMTGFVDDFSYDQAIDAGASDFIKKPFSIHELLIRIKHVVLHDKLREMSMTDELTGLPNRRGFFAVALQQLKVANRTKGAIALLFADLDEFKAINDTWGHQQGDEALIAIADIFRRTFRESDLIARMSGDEFAILLINTPETDFGIIQRRLQNNIDEYNTRLNSTFKLSVSIGMAMYNHDRQHTVDDLLKQADTRMYTQKQLKNKSTENGPVSR